jgi:hypothetical protein
VLAAFSSSLARLIVEDLCSTHSHMFARHSFTKGETVLAALSPRFSVLGASHALAKQMTLKAQSRIWHAASSTKTGGRNALLVLAY